MKGYSRAVFSGLTADALTDVIAQLLEDGPELTGLFHVASEPIDKWSLLSQINEQLDLGITIDKDHEFVCDRSLDGARFTEHSSIKIPSWEQMIGQLAC